MILLKKGTSFTSKQRYDFKLEFYYMNRQFPHQRRYKPFLLLIDIYTFLCSYRTSFIHNGMPVSRKEHDSCFSFVSKRLPDF